MKRTTILLAGLVFCGGRAWGFSGPASCVLRAKDLPFTPVAETFAPTPYSGSSGLTVHACPRPPKVLVYGITASDNLVSDPRFRHRGTRDYRLAASSRCLSLLGRDPAALFRR